MKASALLQGQGFRNPAALALMTAVSVAVGVLLAENPVRFSIAAIVTVALVILTTKHPEVVLALFITAGDYKDDPRFQVPFMDTTVFLGMLTAMGILWAFIQKRVKLTVPPIKMFAPFLVICCLSALSLTYTVAPVYGSQKFFRFVAITGLAFFGAFYTLQEDERRRNFFAVYVLIALAMVFDIVKNGAPPPPSKWWEDEVSAFGSNYLATGTLMGAAFIVILMYFFMTDRSPVRKAIYLTVLCPATFYALMLTGARGPLITLALTLPCILIFARRPHADGRRMTFWVSAVIGAAAVFLTFGSQNFARMTRRLTVLDEGGGASALERIYMAKAALTAMSTMPYLIIGLGIGGFTVYYGRFDAARGLYPHNILLELGSELGIVGLAAGICLLAWSFQRVYSFMKRTTGKDYYTAVAAMALFIYLTSNALKSGDLNDARFLFVIMGLIYSLGRGTKCHATEKETS